MPLIEWNDSYCVGAAEIDAEHKEIFRLSNALFDAIKEGKGPDTLRDLLFSLMNYLELHFSTEEKLMSEHNYHDYKEHKKQHDRLRKRINKLRGSCDRNDGFKTLDVIDFLQDALMGNIFDVDLKMKPFFTMTGKDWRQKPGPRPSNYSRRTRSDIHMAKTNDRSLEMLSTALALEENGTKFYENARQKCNNEMGKDLFDTLKKDEFVHMRRIRIIYDALNAGHGWAEEWKELKLEHGDLKTLFKGLANKHRKNIKADSTDIEALAVGIDLEQKSIKFYSEHREKATDKLEQAFLDRMVIEERTHFDALLDMQDYLADPAAWFMKKERHLPVGP